MKVTPKKAAIRGPLICIILGLGVFGYLEIFTKGLERLPAKVCDGAVDREIAADALPDTQRHLSAEKCSPPGTASRLLATSRLAVKIRSFLVKLKRLMPVKLRGELERKGTGRVKRSKCRQGKLR